jgi:peroxiredoxin
MIDEKPKNDAAPRKLSPTLLLFLIVPLVGIMIALVMIVGETATHNRAQLPDNLNPQSASLINFTAPNFELFDMNGKLVKLEDYQGRILLLNFWQTTCAPCIKELPDFADFAADQGATGAAVLAVNFDETPQMVSDFFAEHEIGGIPVVLDQNSAVRNSYGVMGIPVTYFIDADGIVRDMHLGALSYALMEKYVEQVTSGGAS